MTGCNNKRRFSLKYPDGTIARFGSCDPKIDDGREIINDKKCAYTHETYFLVQGQPLLFPHFSEIIYDGTLWTNGYYDKEHDGWKPPSEWT